MFAIEGTGADTHGPLQLNGGIQHKGVLAEKPEWLDQVPRYKKFRSGFPVVGWMLIAYKLKVVNTDLFVMEH